MGVPSTLAQKLCAILAQATWRAKKSAFAQESPPEAEEPFEF